MPVTSKTDLLNKIYPFLSYLSYWFKKEDKYSLHSPQLFSTYQNLHGFINARMQEDLEIESFRKQLLSTDELIEVEDFGAGSKSVNTAIRPVADITRFSTSSRKYAQLYQFFCTLTPADVVLELGTCVGISTRYLSKVTAGKLYTFEGSKELARISNLKSEFDKLTVIIGKLSETLPETLDSLEKVDFALIDATHTYSGTLAYFEQILIKMHPKSILVIGDIHWSKEMEKAWEEIKNRSEVRLSLDFYECGVLFLDYPGEKTEYVLSF